MSKNEEAVGGYTPGPWEYDGVKGVLAPSGRNVEASGLSLVAGYRPPTDPAFTNAHLIALAPRMERMLRELEWVYDGEYSAEYCSRCDYGRTHGHASDCTLDALLRELPLPGEVES